MRILPLVLMLVFVQMDIAAQTSSSSAQTIGNTSQIHPPAAGHRFPESMALEYKGEWRIFDAGVATVRIEAANGQQRVFATADSTGFVAKLFHVHDTFESFFDPRTFCSLQLTKRIEEGSRVRDVN